MPNVSDPPKGRVRNRMKIILAEREMNIEKLAETAGLHYTTAQRFCSGKQKNANWDVTAKVCEALNIQVGDIFVHEYPEGE